MIPKKIPVKKDGVLSYEITLADSFDLLPDSLAGLDLSNRKICVITDSNVEKLYAREVVTYLEGICRGVFLYVFNAGEEHKNLDEVRKIYTFLIENGFERKDIIAALGGGVTGDMAGFAAATYLRGIRFVQIPTTLLSQVDSSIGGKTGVDFDSFKNMVGAFHMPSAVYINVNTLLTLSDEQFACGMGEVLKHGLIKDAAYYEWTIGHMSEIDSRDTGVLAEMVEGSCQIKRAVVEADPHEQGERAKLNFGHTIGHAIEKLKDFSLPHGHCVALGSAAAAYISLMRGYLTEDEFYEVRDMNVGFNLPITFDGLSPEDILEAMKHDKKMEAGQIRFILLKKIGKAVIVSDVTENELRDAIRQITWQAG